MKKIISILLLAAALLSTASLTACMSNDNANDQTDQSADQTTEQNGDGSDQKPSEDNSAVEALSLQEVADSVRGDHTDGLTLESFAVEDDAFAYYFGIEKPEGVKDALAVEPPMTSVAFSLCLLRVEEDVDAEALAREIEESVDPNKWLCVSATCVKTAVRGNTIILVMDGDDARGRALIDEFNAI